MKTLAKTWAIYAAVAITCLLTVMEDASAVPSYSRRYGEQCSTCHSMWGALTASGVQFRLSGYRAIGGKDLTPIAPDTKIAKNVAIPATLPLSFITGVGFDSRTEKRTPTGGATTTSTGSSIAIEDASIFMTSPLGDHLSAFVEFPMYETKSWEFTPTGTGEARATPPKNVKFATEKPTFEVAKFFWNNLLGDSAPRDSVNLLGGITHLPLGYASGKVRLSVNQYLIYERTALSLISPKTVNSMVNGGEPNDFLFRLGEPQGIAEVNGMLTFGKPVTDIGKSSTFWAEYHLGVTNSSNDSAANKAAKDVYGRWVMRYLGQSLGVSAYHSGDTYGDRLTRDDATGMINNPNVAAATLGNIAPNFVGGTNKTTRWGPDMTISLVPMGVPVWLENEFMLNNETNPTGYGKEFKWKGGFSQLNWKVSKNTIAYGRYDWLKGDAFDDTSVSVRDSTGAAVFGVTKSTPKERDFILGFQHLIDENVKFIFEARHHVFDDAATGVGRGGNLTDNGFTTRVMFGF